MKLFTTYGESLSFNEYKGSPFTFNWPFTECLIATDRQEEVVILVQMLKRPEFELYFIDSELKMDQQFTVEIDQLGKCFWYQFEQEVGLEFGNDYMITIPEKKFNFLPVTGCKIHLSKGSSAWTLIRLLNNHPLFDVKLQLPFMYSMDYDIIRLESGSYTENLIMDTLDVFLYASFPKKNPFKKLDEVISLITLGSWDHILDMGGNGE